MGTKGLTVKRCHRVVAKSISIKARLLGFKSLFYHLLAPSLEDKDNDSAYLVKASVLHLTHDKC